MLRRLVSDAIRLRVVTALRRTMQQPDLLYQCLRGSSVTTQSSWGSGSFNRPHPASAAARIDGRRGSRNSTSLASNVALLSRLEEKKIEAATEHDPANVAGLIRSVLLESKPALRDSKKQLQEEVNRGRMLLTRGINDGQTARAKRIIARADIGAAKRCRRFEVRRRKPYGRKRIATRVGVIQV